MRQQAIEDVIMLAREFPNIPAGKLTLALQELSKHTAALQKLNEIESVRSLYEREIFRKQEIRKKISAIVLATFGIKMVEYHTDPRAIAARFKLPSGQFNLWDGQNFGIRF